MYSYFFESSYDKKDEAEMFNDFTNTKKQSNQSSPELTEH